MYTLSILLLLMVLHIRLKIFLHYDSAVGIETGYGLDDEGIVVLVPVGSRIFSFSRRPDRLWGTPSLFNAYRRLFPRG
jgi:hypothetical protein